LFLYSLADKRKFYKELFEYVKTKPDEILIWCPHPAEMMVNTFSKSACEFKPNNLLHYGLHEDIYFHGIEGSDDLIFYCSYAISTVTTCLLDYEIHDKRVNVFDCIGVRRLISKFKSISKFSQAEEIKKNAVKIETVFLKKFDVKIFDDLISQSITDDSFKNYHYIP